MDGNSTWAKKNNKAIMDGYLEGMRTMTNVIPLAKNLGLKYVTFYAFSSENWGRPKKWLFNFMKLITKFLNGNDMITKALEANARVNVIGDLSKLSAEFQNILKEYVAKTIDNQGMTIQLAINYGGRDEIVRAARKVSKLGLEFTEENISDNLDTGGIPDPELIIRTSGKQRISNFLLWQASYSEFYFSDVLWPDFGELELQNAINEFLSRKRTYGK
jgi:undecaprenyl diphosphate synthase